MNRAEIFTNQVITLMPNPGEMDEAHKNHFTYFLCDDAKVEWLLPKNPKTGRYVEILTPEEREVFEEELKADLSFMLRDKEGKIHNPFWAKFRVSVVKDASLMTSGRKFYMADPVDNLSVRILRTFAQYPLFEIAPSKEELRYLPGARWYLTDRVVEEGVKLKKENLLAQAYIHYGGIKDSVTKMLEFIRLYGSTHRHLQGTYDESMSIEALSTIVLSILKDDLEGYIETSEDGNVVAKLFIEDAIACGAIIKKDGEYRLKGGDALNPLDPSLMGTVEWYIEWQTLPTTIYTSIAAKVDKHRSKPRK